MQEENVPKHRGRLCTSRKAENATATMDCVTESPDLTPIEKMWSAVKSFASTVTENLVESMPRRRQAKWKTVDNGRHFG